MKAIKGAYERAMRPIDMFFDQLEDLFWVLVWLATVLIGTGLSLAYWFGITGAAWKYLLG